MSLRNFFLRLFFPEERYGAHNTCSIRLRTEVKQCSNNEHLRDRICEMAGSCNNLLITSFAWIRHCTRRAVYSVFTFRSFLNLKKEKKTDPRLVNPRCGNCRYGEPVISKTKLSNRIQDIYIIFTLLVDNRRNDKIC